LDEKNKEFENTVKNIIQTLRQISHQTYVDSRKGAKPYGITAAQAAVIKTLYSSEKNYSLSALSRVLEVTPPNITGIIDRLEEKRMVKRKKSEGDRRKFKIELTAKGIELAKNLPDIAEQKLMHGLKDLSPASVHSIYSGLSAISKAMGAEFFEKNAGRHAP
jgi:DNA-binding MarR family transcriptional regulator